MDILNMACRHLVRNGQCTCNLQANQLADVQLLPNDKPENDPIMCQFISAARHCI